MWADIFFFRLLRSHLTYPQSSLTHTHSQQVLLRLDAEKNINPTRLFKWHVLRIVNDEFVHVANKFLLLHLIFIWLVVARHTTDACLRFIQITKNEMDHHCGAKMNRKLLTVKPKKKIQNYIVRRH